MAGARTWSAGNPRCYAICPLWVTNFQYAGGNAIPLENIVITIYCGASCGRVLAGLTGRMAPVIQDIDNYADM